MTADEIRNQVVQILLSIAPDIDQALLDPNADLREDYDLDSMDSLTLATDLHKRLGVNIPESEFHRLSSVNQIVDYLYQNQQSG